MLSKICDQKILPAITFSNLADVIPVSESLSRGGISVMEIAVRTDIAFHSIRRIRQELPGITTGAGTILNVSQLHEAIDAGAVFGLSPSLNLAVVKEAVRLQFPFIPGVMTPSEIETAFEFGCSLLKLFPANSIGGISFLRAMQGPYAHLTLQFIPMGGINLQNMKEYLQLPNVAAVGGSWLVTEALLGAKNYAGIEQNAKDAVQMIVKE